MPQYNWNPFSGEQDDLPLRIYELIFQPAVNATRDAGACRSCSSCRAGPVPPGPADRIERSRSSRFLWRSVSRRKKRVESVSPPVGNLSSSFRACDQLQRSNVLMKAVSPNLRTVPSRNVDLPASGHVGAVGVTSLSCSSLWRPPRGRSHDVDAQRRPARPSATTTATTAASSVDPLPHQVRPGWSVRPCHAREHHRHRLVLRRAGHRPTGPDDVGQSPYNLTVSYTPQSTRAKDASSSPTRRPTTPSATSATWIRASAPRRRVSLRFHPDHRRWHRLHVQRPRPDQDAAAHQLHGLRPPDRQHHELERSGLERGDNPGVTLPEPGRVARHRERPGRDQLRARGVVHRRATVAVWAAVSPTTCKPGAPTERCGHLGDHPRSNWPGLPGTGSTSRSPRRWRATWRTTLVPSARCR